MPCDPPTDDAPLLVAGSASRVLGAAIAADLGLPLGRGEVLRFCEGNVFVRVLDNVRGRQVYLVQGTVFPANSVGTSQLQTLNGTTYAFSSWSDGGTLSHTVIATSTEGETHERMAQRRTATR